MDDSWWEKFLVIAKATAIRCGLDYHSAEDIAQQAALNVIKSGVRPRSLGLAKVAAHNLVIQQVRKGVDRRELPIITEVFAETRAGLDDPAIEVAEHAAASTLRDRAVQIIGSDRLAFLCRYSQESHDRRGAHINKHRIQAYRLRTKLRSKLVPTYGSERQRD